jgi:hypothetical protein
MRRLVSLVLLLAAGCFPPASIPAAERQHARHELRELPRFARVAVYLAPFPGDLSSLLLTDQPLEALEKAAAARVLPPGTPLRLEQVEFPAGWEAAGRAPGTPRLHPWAYLRLAGEARPLIMVLPRTLATTEEVRAALERVLSASDPAPAFDALPETQRAAIRRKQLEEGMPADAVEMAWGQPERKVLEPPSSREEWLWPGAHRQAQLEDGRLVSWSER